MIIISCLASRILWRARSPQRAPRTGRPVQPTFDWHTDWVSELMTIEEIRILEEELQRLSYGGDDEAGKRYFELERLRKDWERTSAAEDWDEFVFEAQSARTWLRVRA